MAENKLLEAFNRSSYPVAGHGKRTVGVLQEALATVDAEVDSDVYGSGKLIEDFQAKMADVLGKETAVFFPSGTMAQQIALRIWSDRKGLQKVAYHPLSHLEIHEEDGLKKLHGLESVLLGEKDRVPTLADIQKLGDDVACVLLELPQREIGGQLPEFAELEAISAYCRERGIVLHLDGARLFEILPFYQKTAAEVCALFDSVYVSFYKGIGAIAGAILAGDESFTKESKVWKRRHGGDLISLYPYILSADYYYEQRVPKMAQYMEEARELAALYNECPAVETRPEVPVSNMMHVHIALPKEQVEPIFVSVCEETGVGLTASLREVDADYCYFEVSIGDRYATVPKEALRKAFALLSESLGTVAR
ncbi:threonine aldolase family protein [Tumebacillus flagellatus]|uniref:Threonine aldolase n=1 Tax=Tumebacillus flagellatus TaxID=1157490 RepID=A0A074LS16_9BACL|nr:beta-eliminating lyase-related protein [Tumebacillus flagellatus]KEO84946.1 threonine aldolase [Tumebacillus flagellatus]